MNMSLKCEPCGVYRSYIKGMSDRLAAALMLMVSLPVVLLAAALVRATSAGPAFYSQVRLGRHGRPYRIYKIRTMQHNCEAASGPVWAQKDDPRVTRVGRILRQTHLDELPQLWNVLRGEMSLVGPRPERPEIVRELERALPAYRTRLEVKPGITGLAQMLLPADSDLESVRRKLHLDVHYVREAGLRMDLRIMLATPLHLLAGLMRLMATGLVGAEGERAQSHAGAEDRGSEQVTRRPGGAAVSMRIEPTRQRRDAA